MTYFKREAIVLVAILLSPMFIGVGASIWYGVRGNIIFDLQMDVPFSKLHPATLEALKILDLPIKKHEKDKLTAKIESQFADGQNVRIGIRAVTESSSQIEVRVGVLGDEFRSRKIINAIFASLSRVDRSR